MLLSDYSYNVRDLGLCILKSESGGIKEIMGVMPYVAPELFIGGTYSQASDIYAFGIIMWEISSSEKPFLEMVHGKELAQRIFTGVRPTITDDTPQFYRDLMQKCWHSDPLKRPTAEQIYELTASWDDSSKRTGEIIDQFEEAEEIRKRNLSTKKETQTPHPGAIYTSRLMPNISKGKRLVNFISGRFNYTFLNSYVFFILELISLNLSNNESSVGIQSVTLDNSM